MSAKPYFCARCIYAGATLLAQSHGTLSSSRYKGEAELRVILVKSVISAVAMVPHKGDCFFLAEKPGLEVAWLGGVTEELTDKQINLV